MQLSLKINATFSLFYCNKKLALVIRQRPGTRGPRCFLGIFVYFTFKRFSLFTGVLKVLGQRVKKFFSNKRRDGLK